MAPLIVIAGPTASGKSQLALAMAEKWGGEIICADSRTIYQGMDVGTAKPTDADQLRIRHWGLDVVKPGERFTAHDFKQLALAAMADIRSRNKVPFLVGGTGLYIDGLILDYSFANKQDLVLRKKLETMTTEELKMMIKRQHLRMPENTNNRRHLIRCIEKNNVSTSRKTNPDVDTQVIALTVDRDILEHRIRQRIKEMFQHNIVQETQRVAKRYGPTSEAMTGNVYPYVQRLIDGELDQTEAEELAVIRDRQLAKRQVTWLKRHDFVQWMSFDEAKSTIDRILANYRDGQLV